MAGNLSAEGDPRVADPNGSPPAMSAGLHACADWSERGTTPDAIESALRGLLRDCHAQNSGLLPARVLNMVVLVDSEAREETIGRLQHVGRYHASRLIVLSYEPARERLDACATIVAETDPRPGDFAALREAVTVEIGARHLDDLPTIVDPLLVPDLPTLLWSPGEYRETVDELLGVSQAILLDSIDEPVWRKAIERAACLSREVYVVDLAWLRSTPWRERVAMIFDPPGLRPELEQISAVEVRHHPESTVAGLLLLGWLASRLDWRVMSMEARPTGLEGEAAAGGRVLSLSLRSAPEQQVPGLAGLTLRTANGYEISLDRGAGGLRARMRDPSGAERGWTVVGASRGESGILGEGIRQALLRDGTYVPALRAAEAMVP